MDDCKHESIEKNSYPISHYGAWKVVTVEQCEDCGEILNEESKEL
ncbi:hypothetical protein [Priestia filamentosa]|nr:hypothetical protein [Priestia filamentosa]